MSVSHSGLLLSKCWGAEQTVLDTGCFGDSVCISNSQRFMGPPDFPTAVCGAGFIPCDSPAVSAAAGVSVTAALLHFASASLQASGFPFDPCRSLPETSFFFKREVA